MIARTRSLTLAGLLGAAALLTSAGLQAQPMQPGEGMPGHHSPMGMGMGAGPQAAPDPVARAQQHLADLKAELKISPAQDKAWQAFASRVGQQASAAKAQRDAAAPGKPASAPAPELMAQHMELMKQHLAGMETVQKALKDLYAVLTSEQRTTADRHFARMHETMNGHGMGHHHGALRGQPGQPGMPGMSGHGPMGGGMGGPGPRGPGAASAPAQ